MRTHPKHLLFIPFFTGLVLLAHNANAEPSDEDILTALATKFALGFWNASAEEILSTVHPDLSKKGVTTNWMDSGRQIMETLPPDRLEVLAVTYNANGRLDDADGPRVILHEIDGDFASLEMVNGDWYDFFHAVKLNGQWTLLNCVYSGIRHYEPRDEMADRALIEAVLDDFIAGLAGDTDRLERSLHVNLERRQFQTAGPATDFIQPLAREHLVHQAGELELSGMAAEILIHNQTNRVAAARIDFEGWTEHVQLLRINGDWSIVNSFVTEPNPAS